MSRKKEQACRAQVYSVFYPITGGVTRVVLLHKIKIFSISTFYMERWKLCWNMIQYNDKARKE
jgi:hypothetical protein